MSAVAKTKLTKAEYLAMELAAEHKSEFYNGDLFPLHNPYGTPTMAGASREHNRIKDNLIIQIGRRTLDGPCQSFSSDQRVKLTDTGMFAYPDIVLVCDPPAFAAENRDTLINPQVVIEILSPSTERYDRGFKFAQYQRQATIREVVFVSQDEPRIEQYVRQADGTWLLKVFADQEGKFSLATVPVEMSLAEVYRGVG